MSEVYLIKLIPINGGLEMEDVMKKYFMLGVLVSSFSFVQLEAGEYHVGTQSSSRPVTADQMRAITAYQKDLNHFAFDSRDVISHEFMQTMHDYFWHTDSKGRKHPRYAVQADRNSPIHYANDDQQVLVELYIMNTGSMMVDPIELVYSMDEVNRWLLKDASESYNYPRG